MSLGHIEKETLTHKNGNTLQVYRYKSVHFFFIAKSMSSNTFRRGGKANATSPNSDSNFYFKLNELLGLFMLNFQGFR